MRSSPGMLGLRPRADYAKNEKPGTTELPQDTAYRLCWTCGFGRSNAMFGSRFDGQPRLIGCRMGGTVRNVAPGYLIRKRIFGEARQVGSSDDAALFVDP